MKQKNVQFSLRSAANTPLASRCSPRPALQVVAMVRSGDRAYEKKLVLVSEEKKTKRAVRLRNNQIGIQDADR